MSMHDSWAIVRRIALLGVVVLTGCATPAQRQANLAQSAPKTTRLSDEGCYAACSYDTVGGHLGPWIGPLRSDRADALRDANQHDHAYPGHHSAVIRY